MTKVLQSMKDGKNGNTVTLLQNAPTVLTCRALRLK